jgi:plasmid stabilization system protein ParE
MSLRVKISARAAAEIRRAADWWLANRPAAPGAIGTDFADAVALLAEQPGIGAKYEGTRVSGARRLFRSRVGYFIYDTTDAEDLKVLAFWHSSREHQPRL